MKTIFAKMILKVTTAASVSIASLVVTIPVMAASFIPFSFKTNVTASPDPTGNLLNDPTRDIRLDSVVFNGNTISNFEVVKQRFSRTIPTALRMEVYWVYSMQDEVLIPLKITCLEKVPQNPTQQIKTLLAVWVT